MAGAVVAYRSTNPEVLTEWEAWKADMREYSVQVRAFKESVDPDDQLTLHAYRHGGIAFLRGDVIPDGWRKNPRGNIVPNKRLKAGKAADAHMEQVRRAFPRDPQYRLAGVPDMVISGDRFYEPGFFFHDGALYMFWGGMPSDVDLGVWTELKLSEFYAAKEAYEAVHETELAA